MPVSLNKAGANYKSEVAHLTYGPRQAYEEWLGICEGILALGGDALFDFEPEDDPYLGHEALRIDGDGRILAEDSRDEVLGHIDGLQTGRVFTANGPWVIVEERQVRALLPNMLPPSTT